MVALDAHILYGGRTLGVFSSNFLAPSAGGKAASWALRPLRSTIASLALAAAPSSCSRKSQAQSKGCRGRKQRRMTRQRSMALAHLAGLERLDLLAEDADALLQLRPLGGGVQGRHGGR